MPLPLNVGAREATGVDDDMIRADKADTSGASNRETGE